MSGLLFSSSTVSMSGLLLSPSGNRVSLPCKACTKKLRVSYGLEYRTTTYMPNTGMRITRASAGVGTDRRMVAHS